MTGSYRMWVPHLPETYDGSIFFLIGPGLGDTVNGFRILHEVLTRFHRARPVVYLDPRWKSLYPLIPELKSSDLRYFTEAPSAEAGAQSIPPFHRTYQDILDRMQEECEQQQGCIAVAGFKLTDRLARKENSIAMMARAIGLEMPLDRQRPYCPLSEQEHGDARAFLEANGLREREYAVISPFTWKDKMWREESWSSLADSLFGKSGLQILVMALDGQHGFNQPFVKQAMNLPLGTVAALIAKARCYIGLDSGLTHVAASSDVPLVTLNPQGKYPPFCVEPHSPYRWTHLSPNIYGNKQIPAESVEALVGMALQSPSPPRCPVCEQSPYVLHVDTDVMLMVCRCGLVHRFPAITSHSLSTKEKENCQSLPTQLSGLREIRRQLNESLSQRAGSSGEVDLCFEHWDPIEMHPRDFEVRSGRRDLWWTWDAAFRFLESCGWRIVNSCLVPTRQMAGMQPVIQVKAVPKSLAKEDAVLAIPWGRKAVRIRRSFYERWLSWGTFRHGEELSGLALAAAGDGDVKAARTLSVLAFKLNPGWKSFRRSIRVWTSAAKTSQPGSGHGEVR